LETSKRVPLRFWRCQRHRNKAITTRGNFGANQLSGEAGDDTLNGGGANDTLTGGTGQDTFVRANQNAQGVDVITDFDVTPSTGDILDISAILIGFKDGASELDDFVRATASGNNTLVQVNANGVGTDFVTLFVLEGVQIDTTNLLPHIDATVPTDP
jgi:Ca2+-binding RTX toxin-like protein